MDLYIEKMKSEKSNKEYVCLIADLGYTKQPLTYDTSIMILLSNLTPQEFYKKTEVLGSRIDIIRDKQIIKDKQ